MTRTDLLLEILRQGFKNNTRLTLEVWKLTRRLPVKSSCLTTEANQEVLSFSTLSYPEHSSMEWTSSKLWLMELSGKIVTREETRQVCLRTGAKRILSCISLTLFRQARRLLFRAMASTYWSPLLNRIFHLLNSTSSFNRITLAWLSKTLDPSNS